MSYLRSFRMVIVGLSFVSAILSACAPSPAPLATVAGDSAAVNSPQSPAAASSATTSRSSLLTTAFAVASSMPVDPHGRDRSRLQEAVARACLDSDMVDQAAELADQMQGWRRGHVIALCGQYFARRGQTGSARDCADRALLVDVGDTTWGKDVVVTEVAKIYVLLGDESRAYSLVAVGQPTERGQVETARTARVPMDQMDGQADMFDQAIATGNFDLARGGIDGYLVWLDRVIGDAPRRARALTALSGAFPGLPLDLQVRYRVQLAEVLYSRGYKELAKTEVDRASALFKATVFLPEDTAPLGAVIAKARFRMGDADSARSELRALRAAYNAQSDLIVNLRRAASLRALAEGFLLLGDSDDAVESYKAALDAGAINPNARPRAEDLSATCVSMAMSGFQPSPEFMLRIDNLRAGLVDPW